MTVAEAAKLMNVSERMVYMARRIIRSGRTDVIEAVEAGAMSLNAANKMLDGRQGKPKDRYHALCVEWDRADDNERQLFLARIDAELRGVAE